MAGVLVKHEALRALGREILVSMGSDAREAGIVADHLVDANLSGHDSHGVGLLPTYVRERHADFVRPNRKAILVREDGVFGILDGDAGYGHVMAREATEWGIARAREKGAAIVTLRNAHHIARVGTYAEMAIEAGMVSIFFVNVVAGGLQKVAPFGGSDARLHTNPICIGVPMGSQPPFVLDFATSKIAMGKVRVAYNEKRKVAPGVLIDSRGVPTTEAAVLFEEPYGAIVPFGDHKGFGLAVMCELLGGVLSGGATNQDAGLRPGGLYNNLLAIFIDPTRFGELPYFHREIEAVLAHVKASPPANPGAPVLTAGEPERAYRKKRGAEGIPVDAVSWREILDAADNAGVSDAAIAAAASAAR